MRGTVTERNFELLDRFTSTLDDADVITRQYVADYLTRRRFTLGETPLSGDDDVDLRNYFMDLRNQNTSVREQKARTGALKRFYTWLRNEGFIKNNPFVSFNFDRPYLTRADIRRRKEIYAERDEDRQIERLEMLNKLAEQLNRAPDIHTALDAAVRTILQLMGLKTAWAYLFPEPGELLDPDSTLPMNDFVLAAFFDLPQALERQNKYWLCPPYNCHCLHLMRKGQLQRAVNIVECTRLMESAEADGDTEGLLFHASVPLIASGKPLGVINLASEEWQFLTAADLQLLSGIGAQVATALERARLYDISNNQRLRLEKELDMARQVQRSLLPQQMPEIPGFRLAAEWYSAREMAGDFYDIFQLPNGRWGLVMADVADKGAAAALYMAMTSSLIRASANFLLSPAETLMEVNQRILAHCSSEMFVTVFYGLLDAGSNQLTYASAGHNPALLRRLSGEFELLNHTGAAIGIFDNLEIREVRLDLLQGDRLVAYTDGITEAFNPEGEQYGIESLKKIVRTAPQGDARYLVSLISDDLESFIRAAPQSDDVTLMVLECLESDSRDDLSGK